MAAQYEYGLLTSAQQEKNELAARINAYNRPVSRTERLSKCPRTTSNQALWMNLIRLSTLERHRKESTQRHFIGNYYFKCRLIWEKLYILSLLS